MRTLIFAAAALAASFAGPAGAQPATNAAQPTVGQRCDRDGCWTYNCDATSNHCHRHWVASTPRGVPVLGAVPPAHRTDQICDINGDNCSDASAEPPPG